MIQVYPKVVEDALKWQGLELAGISAERIPPALVNAGLLDPEKEWHYGGRTPPGTYVFLELNEVYSNLLAVQSWQDTIVEWVVPEGEYDPENPPVYVAPAGGVDVSKPPRPDNTLPGTPVRPDNTLPPPSFGIDNALPPPPSTIDNTLPTPPAGVDNTLPDTSPPNVISGGPADKPVYPSQPIFEESQPKKKLKPEEKEMYEDLNKLAEEDEKKKKK